MATASAVRVDANELGSLSLSRNECLESECAVSIVGESVFMRFCMPDLKAGYSVY